MGVFSRLKTYANGGKLFPSDLNTLQDGIAATVNHIDSSNVDDGTIGDIDLAPGPRAEVVPSNGPFHSGLILVTWGSSINLAVGSGAVDPFTVHANEFTTTRSGLWLLHASLFFDDSDSTRTMFLKTQVGDWVASSLSGNWGAGAGSWVTLMHMAYMASGERYIVEVNNTPSSSNSQATSRVRAAYLGA